MNKSYISIIAIGFFINSNLVVAGAYEDFFKAIQLDRVAPVKALLARGFDPNTPADDGAPALLKAMQEQSFNVAELLLNHPETKPHARSNAGETPLMLAALRGQEKLVIELVARGAEVNHEGWTALHYAATAGHPRIAAFLLGVKSDVNAISSNGTTPLMMAAMYGNAETVKVLLQAGAEAYPVNDLGLTAEDFAIQADRPDSLKLIRQALKH